MTGKKSEFFSLGLAKILNKVIMGGMILQGYHYAVKKTVSTSLLLRLLIYFLTLSSAWSDPRLDQITTTVGTGAAGSTGDGGQVTSARLYNPYAAWVDTIGILYVSELNGNKVRRVSTGGIISTVAGNGAGSSLGDGGPLTSASLNSPSQFFSNASSKVFLVAENVGHKLRLLNAVTNIVTLSAGTGASGTAGDGGAATAATLSGPNGVAFDTAGNIYFSMWNGCRVRKIDVTTNIISAFLGADGLTGASPSGTPATSAGMGSSGQLFVETSSNILYVVCYSHNRVYSVSLTGSIMTIFAGGGGVSTGPATAVWFSGLFGAWRDRFGNTFTTELNTHVIKKISVSGIVALLAGTGTASPSTSSTQAMLGDGGAPTSASFWNPRMIGTDTNGYVYVADQLNHKVRKIYDYIPTSSPTMQPTPQPSVSPPRLDQITSVAGSGVQSVSTTSPNDDGGQVTAASLNGPYGVFGDSSGVMYISDSGGNKIRRVDVVGIVTTFGGTGGANSGGDGGALTSAGIFLPYQVHSQNTSSKVFVLAETNGHRVRQLNAVTNKISTIAGSGTGSATGDGGPSTSATVYYPYGVFLDSSGNIYTSEYGGNRVRKIDAATKIMSSYLGVDGVTTVSPDGTAATSAGMQSTAEIHIDTSANVLYVASFGLQKVFTVTMTTGVMNVFAGGSSGLMTGPATSASIFRAFGVWKDHYGNVFVSESSQARVRKINSDGIISLLAGTGVTSATGASTSSLIGDNGPPTSATFNGPRFLWTDSLGYVYIGDQGNNRIRKVYDYIPTNMPTVQPTLSPTKRLDQIVSIAGNGAQSFGGDGGPATAARLDTAYSIWGDLLGVMYVSDSGNRRIRRVDSVSGIITTYVGTGTAGSVLGEGGAFTSASISYPAQIYGNATGKVLYLADANGSRIKQLNVVLNIITTIAGSGPATSTGDGGMATSATLNQPYGVFLDSVGGIYTSEYAGNRVRKIDAVSKIIVAYLGVDGFLTQSTDWTRATSAGMYLAGQLFYDTSTNVLYVAAFGFNVIYTVSTSSSAVTTLVTGTLNTPLGMYRDRFGNTFIAEQNQHRAKKVDSVGIVTTFVGTGTASASGASAAGTIGDGGPPHSATLFAPSLMFADSMGYVYIADLNNQRIRKVYDYTPTVAPSAMPSITQSLTPTVKPTTPTSQPSRQPSSRPSNQPTRQPSSRPSQQPSAQPSTQPSSQPSGRPSQQPSAQPSTQPSSQPSRQPTSQPISRPSSQPSSQPSSRPSRQPWSAPSSQPSEQPSSRPSRQPSLQPSDQPTQHPSSCPSVQPSARPSKHPSQQPLARPSSQPSVQPTQQPVDVPSSQPSRRPSSQPSRCPSRQPSAKPSSQPTRQPSRQPTTQPSVHPTTLFPPTIHPSVITAYVTAKPTLTPPRLDQITSVAGNGFQSANGASTSALIGDGGEATAASLYSPSAVWGNSSGVLYVSDLYNNKIRRVDMGGIITTFAGSGASSSLGDGGGLTSASLKGPYQFIGNVSSNIFMVVEGNGCRVRQLNAASNIMSTLVGTGATGGSTGDGGPATSAVLYNPRGVIIDSNSNIYVSEWQGSRVRKVDVASGIISAYLGTLNSVGVISGLSSVSQLCIDVSTNSMYIAGYGSNKIFIVAMTSNRVKLFAGGSNNGLYSGPATSVTVFTPFGVWSDPFGSVFIQSQHFIAKVDTSGFLSIIAGNSAGSRSPDGASTSARIGDGGSPTSATFYQPQMIWVDSLGYVYVADSSNCRVRKIYDYVPTALPTLAPTVTPSMPTSQPSRQPSLQPSRQPSAQPTVFPSSQPTTQPSSQPLSHPTMQPSSQPLGRPSMQPSSQPSMQPIAQPSSQPTTQPSMQPSSQYTSQPSSQPSATPSMRPSSHPSSQPSMQPSEQPSVQPSSQPSAHPSMHPSGQPSSQPSMQPSARPFMQPSSQPSSQPSLQPSYQPSTQPSVLPSTQLSMHPSRQLSSQPSSQPSAQPSMQPNAQPNRKPSIRPSNEPTTSPSAQPTTQRAAQPVAEPSRLPTSAPSVGQVPLSPLESRKPSRIPTWLPSVLPTASPTRSLPAHTDISVFYSSNLTVDFRIVLPFLFTSGVAADGLKNITLHNASIGTNFVHQGRVVSDNRDIETRSLIAIQPAVSYDFSGRSVSNAADFNGDGYDDLIIGVPYSGKVYILFGTKHGFVNMTEGFTILCASSSDMTGWSVSGAGDVNNDTFADVLIGAPYAGPQIAGAAYVIYGRQSSNVLIDLNNLTSDVGYVIYGVTTSDCLGLSVSGAGDVNGDGFDDVIIGALLMNNAISGASYIVYGQNEKRIGPLQLTTVSSTRVTVLTGSSYSWLGYSVSRAGDVNNDTFADVIIGSVPRKSMLGTPVSYLVYGRKTATVSEVTKMTSFQGVVITGGGVVVSGVGDINGDGFDDVMVGGSDYGFESGGGFVVTFPVTLPGATVKPTYCPSVLPSVIPTTIPSINPSIVPTQPTRVPTEAPSGPTQLPTVTPTQPTSQPSAVPTAPSVAPSVCPSIAPSNPPSLAPSYIPTKRPSVKPTQAPSIGVTNAPISRLPTFQPSLMQTRLPTRYPVVHPTLNPTLVSTPASTNVTFNIVSVKVGGTYVRPEKNFTNFVVNATEDVTISGAQGVAMFTVLPNDNTTLHIHSFKVTTDIINLRAFASIHSLNDLIDKMQTRALTVMDLENHNVTLNLGKGQYIKINNISEFELTPRQFRFADTQVGPAIARMKPSLGPIIAATAVFGSLILFIVWKFGEQMRHNYKIMQLKVIPIDWLENERNNPTYVSFNDNSDRSLVSNVSSLSSSSGELCDDDEEIVRSSDEEDRDSEVSSSVEHDSPQGSVLDGSVASDERTRLLKPIDVVLNDVESRSSDESQPSIVFADDSDSEHSFDEGGVVQRHYAHQRHENMYDEKDSFENDNMSHDIEVVIHRTFSEQQFDHVIHNNNNFKNNNTQQQQQYEHYYQCNYDFGVQDENDKQQTCDSHHQFDEEAHWE